MTSGGTTRTSILVDDGLTLLILTALGTGHGGRNGYHCGGGGGGGGGNDNYDGGGGGGGGGDKNRSW